MLDYPVSLLARVLDARLQGSGEGLVRRVSTDSRDIRPGDLFVALQGERVDGHKFVADALKQGAAAALVAEGRLPAGTAKAGAVLGVPDPLRSLGDLALWHRNRFPNLRMVAVTGSVGKTTTKDLIAGVLGQQWNTLKSPGNHNTEIGLPLALLQLTEQHQAAVMELAMRGPGQIRYLARLVRPEVVAITLIGLSHIELLGSRDAIAAAKGEALDFLPVGGVAVLNCDDRYFDFLSARVPPGAVIQPYGLQQGGRDAVSGMYLGPGESADNRGEALLGSRFSLQLARDRTVHRAWVPLLGKHNVSNALAAAAVGQALGISPLRIRRGLAEAEISAMRMTLHRLPDCLVIDDAYNASSPEAMEGALDVLKEADGLRRVAVLGSMLELGPESDAAHRRVGEYVTGIKPHLLITVGEGGARIAESARAAGLNAANIVTCPDNEAVVAALQERKRPGDVILVKGSRGMAMEHVVRALRGEAAQRGAAA